MRNISATLSMSMDGVIQLQADKMRTPATASTVADGRCRSTTTSWPGGWVRAWPHLSDALRPPHVSKTSMGTGHIKPTPFLRRTSIR